MLLQSKKEICKQFVVAFFMNPETPTSTSKFKCNLIDAIQNNRNYLQNTDNKIHKIKM